MSILWVVAGYSLAFSQGTSILIGDLSKLFMEFLLILMLEQFRDFIAMFQMTFCIITPALVIGAYVERIKFSVILIFSSVWIILVYCPVAYWVWGGGFWLKWV